MKLLLGLWLVTIGCVAGAEFGVRIQSNGTNVTQRPMADFATNVIKLFRSCSVNSTSYAATNAWEKLLAKDSFIHITFSTSMTFRETGQTKLNEVFVPLPFGKFPAHLFARSGTNVFALTKFDPVALGRVAQEPALQLSSVEPYGSLAKLAASRER
jgi:hypothetical protein